MTYEITPNEGLSNGDEVTIEIKIDGDDFEDYDFQLVGETITETVSGLEEVEAVDPFAGLVVTYEGMAPNGEASIDSSSEIEGVTYTMDVSENLSNGDVITITAAPRGSMSEDEFAQTYGYILSKTEQTYTVEGLSGYATTLDEVPEELRMKMLTQAEDTIRADCAGWNEGNSLNKLEFIGYYFLAPKAGFYTSTNNEIYCVYRVTANLTGVTAGDVENETTGTDTYYTYCRFTDLMLLADGTPSVDLSSCSLTGNRCDSTFGSKGFFGDFQAFGYNGYRDLDSMFNDCISTKTAEYNYESTVQE